LQDEHTHELGPEPGAEPQEHQDALPEQEEIVVEQAVAEEAVSEQTVVEEALVEEAVAEEAVIEEVSFALEFQQEPEPEPEFEPAPVLEQAPEPEITIPVAEPAPLVSQPQATESAAPAGAAKELLGLPLQFLSQPTQITWKRNTQGKNNQKKRKSVDAKYTLKKSNGRGKGKT